MQSYWDVGETVIYRRINATVLAKDIFLTKLLLTVKLKMDRGLRKRKKSYIIGQHFLLKGNYRVLYCIYLLKSPTLGICPSKVCWTVKILQS